MIIEINKDIEKYQESVAMGLTFSCYVAVPIVAPIALCGFYSYNGMGFREVFTRYMKSIFRNKTLVFKSGGYREMVSEIRIKEEAEKRAAARKTKEERKQMRKEKVKTGINSLFKKKA